MYANPLRQDDGTVCFRDLFDSGATHILNVYKGFVGSEDLRLNADNVPRRMLNVDVA